MKIDKKGSANCFACGINNPEGLHLKFLYDQDADKVYCRHVVLSKYNGWAGAAHGGAIATLLDEGMVYAALGSCDALVATAKMDVRFKKPVPVDKEILIEGEVISSNKKLITAASRIIFEDVVLAECTGTLSVLAKPDDIYSADNYLAIEKMNDRKDN